MTIAEPKRPIQRQSVRSNRSETAQFTFEEDQQAAANGRRNNHNQRDVTFRT